MIINQTRYNELHILEQVERLIAWNHDEFIYKLGKIIMIVNVDDDDIPTSITTTPLLKVCFTTIVTTTT